MTPRKGYTDGPLGQIHWRMWGEQTDQPDLYCLHPAPFSGAAFNLIAPHLAKGRRVIAPDYPGHGGSHTHTLTPVIADYAEAAMAVAGDLSKGTPVNLMGFHTGCLVAAEMSVIAPEKIGTIVLIDVPAFDLETREKYLTTTGKPFEITPELDCLTTPWKRGMTSRIASQGPDRSFEMFAEQIRHGRGMNAAFYAAFSYDVEARFGCVSSSAAIIASQSGLLEATRRAATLIPQSNLVERLDISRSVLDESAATTADEIISAIG